MSRILNNIINEKKFKGNIKDLLALCQKWLGLLLIGKETFIVNERLVRGYVSEGILPKPERVGKEAIYEYKHFLYFLICRDLFSENWPLSKINDTFNTIQFEELEMNFLQKYDQAIPNDSLEVINDIKKQAPKSKAKTAKQNMASNYAPNIITHSYQNSKQAAKEFGSDIPNVFRDEWITYTLASWLTLNIKNKKLSEINTDTAFRIGNAVKIALLDKNLNENTFIYEDLKEVSNLDQKNQQLEREIFTLKKENLSLENNLKTKEHQYLLRDLDAQKFQDLLVEKEKIVNEQIDRLKNDLNVTQTKYEEKIKMILEKHELDKQQIKVNKSDEMKNLNLKFKEVIEEQKNKIEMLKKQLAKKK